MIAQGRGEGEGYPVIFQDVVPFVAFLRPVVAGAVRKWKSAVKISKARTYRAVFCTARCLNSARLIQLRWVQRPDNLQAPPVLVVQARAKASANRLSSWVIRFDSKVASATGGCRALLGLDPSTS